MKRRAFVTGLGAVLAAPFVAHAQPVVIRRIGVLAATTPDVSAITGFREGLKEQNYVEGRSLLKRCDRRVRPVRRVGHR